MFLFIATLATCALPYLTDCPENVQQLRQSLVKSGYTLKPTMVANRGFHNPEAGSFSIFEMVTGNSFAEGDFFFGHFTMSNDDNELTLDQEPRKGSLMVELIAWDKEKGNYNFFELIGNGKKGQWFYRGDSSDIDRDNTFLYRREKPIFGKKLRCSACHVAGGPIMKELDIPHNDWWLPERPLPLGHLKPDSTLHSIMKNLVSADELAKAVRTGVNKLANSPKRQAFKRTLSLQEQLRPLFCPLEINLASDISTNSEYIQIPSAFFIDPLLGTEQVQVKRKDYEETLRRIGSRFPETSNLDADHAWLTPVKGYSDHVAIQNLIDQKIITEDFAKKILSIDIDKPVYSKTRCDLLKSVPLEDFPSTPPSSKNFNLTNGIQLLKQRREEIPQLEISQNPLGRILEPGFRVIFPDFTGK